MSGQPLTLNCGVPGPDSQVPCVRQTWWWAGRWTGTGWLMRRAAVQRRDAGTARAGWPRGPPQGAAAGGGAEAAGGDGPDGLAAGPAEGGERVLDGRGG